MSQNQSALLSQLTITFGASSKCCASLMEAGTQTSRSGTQWQDASVNGKAAEEMVTLARWSFCCGILDESQE
jgi:hypothetical protein